MIRLLRQRIDEGQHGLLRARKVFVFVLLPLNFALEVHQNFATRLVSAHHRHVDVEHDGLVVRQWVVKNFIQGLLSVFNRIHRIVVLLQKLFDRVEHKEVVVCNQAGSAKLLHKISLETPLQVNIDSTELFFLFNDRELSFKVFGHFCAFPDKL